MGLRTGFAGMMLAATATVAAPASPLSTEQTAALLSAPGTQALAGSLAHRIHASEPAAAPAIIAQFSEDESIPRTRREAAFRLLVELMRKRAPDPAGRAALQQLSVLQETVTSSDRDHPGPPQPAFRVVGSARGVLNEWRYREFCSAIDRMPPAQALALWDGADENQRRMLLTGLRNHDISAAAAVRLIEAAAGAEHDYPAIRLTAGLATGQLTEVGSHIAQVSPRLAMDMLKRLARQRPPIDALPHRRILTAAASHPDAAVRAMALRQQALLAPPAANREHLIELLRDPDLGATAALTLAELLSDEQFAELRHRAPGGQPLLQARLRLIGQLRSEIR